MTGRPGSPASGCQEQRAARVRPRSPRRDYWARGVRTRLPPREAIRSAKDVKESSRTSFCCTSDQTPCTGQSSPKVHKDESGTHSLSVIGPSIALNECEIGRAHV